MTELVKGGASNAMGLQSNMESKVSSIQASGPVVKTIRGEEVGRNDWQTESEDVADEEATFETLTAAEVKALVSRNPQLSPWRVVGLQAAVGLLIAGLWWLGTGQSGAALSSLCGVAAVVLHNALMAWGMTGLFKGIPVATVLGFMFWELIKIMTAVALLAAAAIGMPDLNWPALLVGLIGCLKVNWLALLTQGWMSRKICDKTRDGN
ncbi:ATP synthase subunit I [Roseateles sp. GG27B]